MGKKGKTSKSIVKKTKKTSMGKKKPMMKRKY